METKRGILLASFGTTYEETRKKTLNRIEVEIQEAFPGIPVWQTWTSGRIRAKLFREKGEMILSPEEAFRQMAEEGIQEVFVLPTHLINGFEYHKLVDAALEDLPFDKMRFGRPLLSAPDDRDRMIGAVMQEFSLDDTDALVLMGHGTEHKANAVYATLENRLKELGYANVYMGTVEALPGFDDVFARVQAQHPKRVILAPFLMVAGDHATNDLAGDDPESWKSRFLAAGYPVECVLKGLGEYAGVRKLLLERLAQLLDIEK